MNTDTMLALLDPSLSREERLAQVLAVLGEQAEAHVEHDPEPELDVTSTVAADDAALLADLEELRHRNAVLAAALGACANCWGEHDDCPLCSGTGGPGRRRPDPVAFEVLVAPAMARTQRRRRAVPAARTPNGGTP